MIGPNNGCLKGSELLSRKRAIALFVPYLAFLLYMTLVYHTGHRVPEEARLRLIPFRTIRYFWIQGGFTLIFNNVGNVVVFAPLGFLLPWLRGLDRRTTVVHAALAGGGLSLFIETFQYRLETRVADIDDVLLNLVGSVLGLIVYGAWSRLRRAPNEERPADKATP